MAKTDELKRPQLPGQVDMSKVNSASANVAAARDAVNNLNYDTFKQGADYAGLKKSYEQQGQKAMRDTLGQVAARTGGMASSYAGSAAQQSYNNYMQTLEDAARSMFNDEYSRAQNNYNMAMQEYKNAYGEYRDKRADYESDRDHNYKVDQNAMLDRNTEIEGILGGKNFDWDTYDWDNDGKVGEDDTDGDGVAEFFANSSYGTDYWKQFYQDAQAGYDKEEQLSVSSDISARIANGESLEDIAAYFGIGDSPAGTKGNGTTWEDLTGYSEAEWQQVYNNNEIKGYKYSNDADGATDIVDALTNSATTSLTEKDQKNFDYIFGEGAYDAVQRFILRMSPEGREGFTVSKNMDPAIFKDHYSSLVERLANSVPGLTSDQIFKLIEKINPNAFAAATEDGWFLSKSHEDFVNRIW